MTRTYGKLELSGDTWTMSRTQPHLAIRLKQLFPRIPKHAVAPFTFPNDWPTCADLAWFESRYTMEMVETDRRTIQLGRDGFEAKQTATERILLPGYSPAAVLAGLREDQTIRPYQLQAIDLLMASTGVLCGDEVGLGKTYITAGACLQPGALPAAVVVQTHLQKQWAKKIAEFTTLRTHCIKGTKPYDLPEADVYLFRYSQILGWIDTFEEMRFKLVAYDEVQELRTGTGTGKGAAARRLSEIATYRLGLSATPIMGYGAEIWNIMQFINATTLGSIGDFGREWCGNDLGGHLRDPKALGSYLRDEHVFLRRTKHDVGQYLAPVNRIIETVDYDSKTVEAAEALATALAIKATTGSFETRGRAARELDIMMRQTTGVAKARAVASVARIIVEGGTPLVLVGWHREVYAIWLQALADLKPVMYTGSESPAGKQRAFEAFTSGETDLLILSLRSGAGLDGLQQRCSTMVFGELDWSPGIHHQCLGRLDREGQTEPVTGIFLVVEDGSDPPMMEVLGIKASEATQVTDPSLGVQAVHSDPSKLKGLVERYLNKPKGVTKAALAEAMADVERRMAEPQETEAA